MAFVLGMNGKAYIGDAVLEDTEDATIAGTTWTELDNVTDVTTNLETGEADITTRANNGWRATAATLKDGTVEFEMQWDPEDAGFTAIQAAWAASSEIAAAFMDGPIATPGSQGLVSNFTVTNFTRSEPLEEAMMVSVTLKPSSNTKWYTTPAE